LTPLSHFDALYAVKGHVVWGEIAPELLPSDFNDPYLMDVSFLRILSRARRACGVPFRIVSDHRSAEHNATLVGVTGKIGGAKNSAHTEAPCRAADLHVKNAYERAKVLFALYEEGIRRFGVYEGKEGDAGSLHADASSYLPSPRLWTKY
jgi:hypothetical protein